MPKNLNKLYFAEVTETKEVSCRSYFSKYTSGANRK